MKLRYYRFPDFELTTLFFCSIVHSTHCVINHLQVHEDMPRVPLHIVHDINVYDKATEFWYEEHIRKNSVAKKHALWRVEYAENRLAATQDAYVHRMRYLTHHDLQNNGSGLLGLARKREEENAAALSHDTRYHYDLKYIKFGQS